MVREVRADDQRSWTIRRQINWSRPDDTGHEFEHDIAAGQVAGVVMSVVIILMVITVVIWKPDGVYLPGWLLLTFVILALLVPAQWVMSRYWTIAAHTYEPLGTAGEYWEGSVRGLMASRHELARVARNLEHHARPDDGHGPLQPKT